MILRCTLINRDESFEEIGIVNVFGLLAFNSDDKNMLLAKVNDISTEKSFVLNLIDLINSNDVDAVHLMNVIEDAITEASCFYERCFG